MSFDYQSQAKNNTNWIPHEIWQMTLRVVRNYDFNRERHRDILEQMKSSSDIDGMPHGSNTTDEVALKAQQAETYWQMIVAVDQAFNCIPEEYREGIRNRLMYKVAMPDYASDHTWKKYKGIFMREVAKRMNYL